MKKFALVAVILTAISTTAFAQQAPAGENSVPLGHAPFGYLDAVGNGIIGGWALDQDRPSSPVQIVIRPWDEPWYISQPTYHVRPDVNAIFGVTGDNHGFTFALPARDCPTPTLRVIFADVVDQETGGWYSLDGAPKSLLCSNDPIAVAIAATMKGSDGQVFDSMRAPYPTVSLWRLDDGCQCYYTVRGSNYTTGEGVVINGNLLFYKDLDPGEYVLSLGGDGYEVARVPFVYDGITPVSLGTVVLKKKVLTTLKVAEGPVVWDGKIFLNFGLTTEFQGDVEVTLYAGGPTATEEYDNIKIASAIVTGPITEAKVHLSPTYPSELPGGTIISVFAEVRPKDNPWSLLARSAYWIQVVLPRTTTVQIK